MRSGVLKTIAGAVLVTALAFVSGCATVPPEEDPVLIKLRELESRLAQVERVLENQGLVNLLAELQQVQQELGELRDQTETLTFETDAARGRQRDLYTDIDRRLNALESGSPAAAATPAGEEGAEGQPAPVVSDRDAYKAAFSLLEEGRYAEAGEAFSEFVATYPDSSLVDNAQYWLAEALYVEREFSRALSEFQRVVDDYPDSRKLPDALLKIGYSHYELEQYDRARSALENLVENHPNSTAARLATQRLERMSGEGR